MSSLEYRDALRCCCRLEQSRTGIAQVHSVARSTVGVHANFSQTDELHVKHAAFVSEHSRRSGSHANVLQNHCILQSPRIDVVKYLSVFQGGLRELRQSSKLNLTNRFRTDATTRAERTLMLGRVTLPNPCQHTQKCKMEFETVRVGLDKPSPSEEGMLCIQMSACWVQSASHLHASVVLTCSAWA